MSCKGMKLAVAAVATVATTCFKEVAGIGFLAPKPNTDAHKQGGEGSSFLQTGEEDTAASGAELAKNPESLIPVSPKHEPSADELQKQAETSEGTDDTRGQVDEAKLVDGLLQRKKDAIELHSPQTTSKSGRVMFPLMLCLMVAFLAIYIICFKLSADFTHGDDTHEKTDPLVIFGLLIAGFLCVIGFITFFHGTLLGDQWVSFRVYLTFMFMGLAMCLAVHCALFDVDKMDVTTGTLLASIVCLIILWSGELTGKFVDLMGYILSFHEEMTAN